MEKAYDLKDLGERLKKNGLNLAEEEVKMVYAETKGWLRDSAVLSTNKIDDLVAPFLDQLDPIVLPVVDKIDGEVG